MNDLPRKIVRFGQKDIYLPKFTVALVRSPNLSPYHAKFQVPLNFSKLDLRDYLFHAYNVRALSIRSFVQQQPLRDEVKGPRRMFRPEAKKFMTIEMDEPFVWPKTPESWEPWGKHDKKQTEDSFGEESAATPASEKLMADRLRRQAKAVLGKKQGTLAEWEKLRNLKAMEVEEPEYRIKL